MTILVYDQMLSFVIASGFGTRGTSRRRLVATCSDILEFGDVQAHTFKLIPKKPRTDRSLRLTECDFATWKSSSISPSSEL
jgi:hypothetical protein